MLFMDLGRSTAGSRRLHRFRLEDLLAAAGIFGRDTGMVGSARLELSCLHIVPLQLLNDVEQALPTPGVQHGAGDLHPPLRVAGHKIGGGNIEVGVFSTAECAMELGREVWACPGGFFAPESRGCNMLIEGGAKIICDSSSISRAISSL